MNVTAGEFDVGAIFITLFGGLAIFLFGMEQMTNALKLVAGERMRSLLARLTTNRFKGVFAGAFVTSVIQSSSVTTVLVVGFISAGLMTLQQSIGVILGADIGTTITAQIVAFKVTHCALILVAGGFALQFLAKKDGLHQYGHMIMGLGLIFFGMEMMSDATRPLRSYEPFLHMMSQMEKPIYGILVGAIFTGIIQSSSATMGVVIVLASQGSIALTAGIALAFGANVGTCVTALLASIGKPRDAVRAGVAHILFKLVGVLIWVGFITPLASFVTHISPAYPTLDGIARLAAETPRQIANAHTLFNIANTFLFIFFTQQIASLMHFLIPDKKEIEPKIIRPKYLDDLMLQTPSLALDIVRMEMGRLGAASLRISRDCFSPIVSGNEQDLAQVEKLDEKVNALHAALVTYLGRISQENLTEEQSQLMQAYLTSANNLENIGDLVSMNLVEVAKKRIERKVVFSKKTTERLQHLHGAVCRTIEQSIQAMVSSDKKIARQVIQMKDEINTLAKSTELHLAERLAANEPNRLDVYTIESEIVEYYKRMYYFAKRISKSIYSAKLCLREENSFFPSGYVAT